MSDPVVLLSTGDVVGPAGGVTDNSMVLFSGTSGKLIKGNNAVVTAAGLALLDDVDAAAQRTTLQLKTGATTDKTVGTNDHTIGRLLKVGDGGILNYLELRDTIYATGKPQDLYGLGFVVGFADGGLIGLAIPGISSYKYGILEINAQWIEPSGAAGIQRRFTDGTTGAVYTQSMATATTWGAWIKNGASAAWRLPADSTTDLNSITEGGWFQGLLGPTNANLPTANAYFYLQVMNYAGSPGNCTQVAYEYTSGNPPRKFTRGVFQGAWTAWSEDWTTANLVKTATATDGTIGRMLKVGDFGLGAAANGPYGQDLNAYKTSGFYRVNALSGTISNSPLGGLGEVILLVTNAVDINSQTLWDYGTGAMYTRTGFNANWTPWQQVQTAATALGVGQTWQVVTGSRVNGTVYTNSTGKPIQLYITGDLTSTTVSVDGVALTGADYSGGTYLNIIVPVGSAYSVRWIGPAMNQWAELR